MNVRELMSSWESASHQDNSGEKYQVSLPLKDASRIEALTGLYPGLNRDEIIAQLIGVALDEVERQMPYKQGKKVVSFDELGDPLYEDVGLTPKYLQLRHQFAQTFHQKKKSA
ncbi:MAG: hypothetical protein ACJA1U_002604 [Bermanella sp.]|jgi:hypothetical protein